MSVCAMPDVSWLSKSHSKSSLGIIISEVLRRLTALSAAAWQLLVNDSSKRAGPTPGAAGHSVAPQERETGTRGTGTWEKHGLGW